MLPRRVWLIVAFAALAAGFAYYASSRPMDLRVYHYGTRGFFDGSRPMYGPASGIGWPLHYRYPPLFMFLFLPLAALPMALSSAIWVALKFAVLSWLLLTFVRRYGPPLSTREWIIPFLLAGAYVIEDFRYQNAQFFVFALVAFSLLYAREYPKRAAAMLALAIAVKVWPLFFVPYFAARRDWKVAAWAMLFAIAFSLLPAVWFGPGETFRLLQEWAAQEFSTQLGSSEIWFPNQSLRGVLMRYLTVIDYSQLPDSNYPAVDVVRLSAETVRSIWMVLAGAAYIGLLWIANERRHSSGLIEHALAFCLLALLQPFTQKYALVVLLWPGLAAGRLASLPVVRNLSYIAMTLILIQPLTPGASTQRLLQVLGFDFAGAALLAAAMAYASLKLSTHSTQSNISVTSLREPAPIESA